MAGPWRAMLRHGRFFSGHRARQTVRPKGGRDRARPSKEDRHGGPWSLVAAGGGSGIPWRAMLRHGRLFSGHRARQTVRPKDGRDRARPSKEDRHGGPWSLMAAGGSGIPWRAMLRHGRKGDDAVGGQISKTDATERVPPCSLAISRSCRNCQSTQPWRLQT